MSSHDDNESDFEQKLAKLGSEFAEHRLDDKRTYEAKKRAEQELLAAQKKADRRGRVQPKSATSGSETPGSLASGSVPLKSTPQQERGGELETIKPLSQDDQFRLNFQDQFFKAFEPVKRILYNTLCSPQSGLNKAEKK